MWYVCVCRGGCTLTNNIIRFGCFRRKWRHGKDGECKLGTREYNFWGAVNIPVATLMSKWGGKLWKSFLDLISEYKVMYLY